MALNECFCVPARGGCLYKSSSLFFIIPLCHKILIGKKGGKSLDQLTLFSTTSYRLTF